MSDNVSRIKEDQSPLVTPEELATFLRVKKIWIYEKVRKGSRVQPMPCIRAGRYLRFHVPTVLLWLEQTEAMAPRELPNPKINTKGGR